MIATSSSLKTCHSGTSLSSQSGRLSEDKSGARRDILEDFLFIQILMALTGC